MVELAEFLRIQSSTHYNNPQRIIRVLCPLALGILRMIPLPLYILEIGNEQIRAKRPLVCLVDDHHAVVAQHRVRHELAHDHAVREVLDARFWGGLFVEAHGVADEGAEGRALLEGDALREGGGGNFARLGDCDDAIPCDAAFEDVLGNLWERVSWVRRSNVIYGWAYEP